MCSFALDSKAVETHCWRRRPLSCSFWTPVPWYHHRWRSIEDVLIRAALELEHAKLRFRILVVGVFVEKGPLANNAVFAEHSLEMLKLPVCLQLDISK